MRMLELENLNPNVFDASDHDHAIYREEKAQNNFQNHTDAITALNLLAWLFWHLHFACYQMARARAAVTAIVSAV
jgi:hypothetical protein